MKQTQTAIKIKNLFAGYNNTAIIENLNFEVLKGEVFVIIGGSGCGKSTLLKNMIGLLPPISGKIIILGENLSDASGQDRNRILQNIGVAFQSGALFGSMTVMENITLPLKEFTRLPGSVMEDIAWLKLKLVGLENSAFLMPGELSGGMKKRAALARAMALDPSIIFLDEPSAGLDPITSAELDHLVMDLASSLGITFVIVTHELASIEAISDRIIMLEKTAKGIIATGTPEQLKNYHTNPYVHNFFNRTTDLKKTVDFNRTNDKGEQ
ncbi:ABC transporter ATP-binding protein [Desulfobacula toluolica]|uniref:ABC transporter, ATP-binding protein n=1 Tax=Desulfobacula toluolica (strain DSM 7467 / Tol2) TaxID=651182 RepID=K0NSP2_DESTT|nr:ATP-binding cassette domain-containing protein [Desulfobacula toluolica]CCK82017.1 ABC transporter, ATP-binding protein [Desulfobacula toluolica Tol2]